LVLSLIAVGWNVLHEGLLPGGHKLAIGHRTLEANPSVHHLVGLESADVGSRVTARVAQVSFLVRVNQLVADQCVLPLETLSALSTDKRGFQ